VRAHLTCIDPRHLDASFAGRTFDAELLADLPAEVDPCGERGEFHTFAFAAPIFSRTVSVLPGETVERDNFIYADLLPATDPDIKATTLASNLPAVGNSLHQFRADPG
jgi:diphthamide synthase (EF-2-diphthine--ammonia ligase)